MAPAGWQRRFAAPAQSARFVAGDAGLVEECYATVYLVVRDHGPAKPGMVSAQIHTFDACNPEGVEHCTDLQM